MTAGPDRLRIAMVIDNWRPIVGGAEVQAQRLAEELARRGHEVQVLTARWGAWPREEVMGGVRVRRLSTLRNALGIPGLRRFGRRWFLAGLARALRSRPWRRWRSGRCCAWPW